VHVFIDRGLDCWTTVNSLKDLGIDWNRVTRRALKQVLSKCDISTHQLSINILNLFSAAVPLSCSKL